MRTACFSLLVMLVHLLLSAAHAEIVSVTLPSGVVATADYMPG